MQNQALTFTGIAIIVCICIVAYYILTPVVNSANVLAIPFWGSMLSATLPLWLAALGLMFSVVLIVAAPGSLNQK